MCLEGEQKAQTTNYIDIACVRKSGVFLYTHQNIIGLNAVEKSRGSLWSWTNNTPSKRLFIKEESQPMSIDFIPTKDVEIEEGPAKIHLKK